MSGQFAYASPMKSSYLRFPPDVLDQMNANGGGLATPTGVPIRVRICTITLYAYLNYLFRLKALASKRIQRAAPLQGAQ